MGSSLYLFMFLCLTSGLIVQGQSGCCEHCRICREGWTMFDNKCFMYFNKDVSWGDAQATCRMNGGTLASITSSKSYDAIIQMIKYATNEDKSAWIGGHDLFKENHWEWTDGSLFSIFKWATNEPSNTNGKEHCIEFNGAGGLNDLECNFLRPFVCSTMPQ